MKLPVPSFQLVGIVAAAAFALGAAGAWRVATWRAAAERADAVSAAARAERVAQQEVITTLHAQITAATAASLGYQNELTTLRTARDSQPVPVVRLCPPARRPVADLPAGSSTPRGPDAAAPAAGELPSAAGRDLGPELYREADDADEIAARLRGLQDWIARLR